MGLDVFAIVGAGNGGQASAADLTRFARAQLCGDGPVTATTLAAMREPYGRQMGMAIWGLGVMLSLYVTLDMFVNMDEFTEQDYPILTTVGNIVTGRCSGLRVFTNEVRLFNFAGCGTAVTGDQIAVVALFSGGRQGDAIAALGPTGAGGIAGEDIFDFANRITAIARSR